MTLDTPGGEPRPLSVDLWAQRAGAAQQRADAAESLLAETRAERDDFAQRLLRAESLLDHSGPRELRETREALERAEGLLREYAPTDRASGSHTEECWFDADDWLYEQWLENADETADGTPYEQRKQVFRAWAKTQLTPTDQDLCADGCPYPRVRAFLARLPTEEEKDG